MEGRRTYMGLLAGFVVGGVGWAMLKADGGMEWLMVEWKS
jgi:hypothetical protein